MNVKPKGHRFGIKEVIEAYTDRFEKISKEELFFILHEMRFHNNRTYHPDGRTTLKLSIETSNKLENIFHEEIKRE